MQPAKKGFEVVICAKIRQSTEGRRSKEVSTSSLGCSFKEIQEIPNHVYACTGFVAGTGGFLVKAPAHEAVQDDLIAPQSCIFAVSALATLHGQVTALYSHHANPQLLCGKALTCQAQANHPAYLVRRQCLTLKRQAVPRVLRQVLAEQGGIERWGALMYHQVLAIRTNRQITEPQSVESPSHRVRMTNSCNFHDDRRNESHELPNSSQDAFQLQVARRCSRTRSKHAFL